MGNPTIPTPDQQAWLKKASKIFGVPSAANASPANVSFSSGSTPNASAQPLNLGFPPRPGNPLSIPGLQIDPQKMQEFLRGEQEKREKAAQQDWEAARKWLLGLPHDELKKLSYPAILAKIKEDFPAVVDLPQPNADKKLMDMVDKVLWDTNYLAEKRMVDDPNKMAMEKLIAAYIAALPKSIKATITKDGIILATIDRPPATAAGAAGATDKFEFKNKNYTIDISNAAWQALDPALRAKWKSLNEEASSLQKIKDTITSLKKEWEAKKDDGTTSKLELELKIKDLEAEFKGRWDTLQSSINATAKLTTDGLKATITETKNKVKDEKVGAELDLSLKDMSVGLKAFATTPDLKTALAITGSAEKITAKIEAEALKTGTVVTLSYEKALKEVKEQLELQVKQGNTTVAAKLSKEAVKLEDQLNKFKSSNSKDFEAVKGLEEGLANLKFQVKAQYDAGSFKISAGGNVASGGVAGGQVQVDVMLGNGIGFRNKGDQKISFAAEVTNKGYKFSLMFTIGEMPELDSVHKANEEATKRIKELYELVNNTQIRSMSDAKKIQEAFTKVMDPLNNSVKAMKKADKKDFALKFGINVSGDLPSSGGRMAPPIMGVGLTITF